jgi:YD repeat-containing protein
LAMAVFAACLLTLLNTGCKPEPTTEPTANPTSTSCHLGGFKLNGADTYKFEYDANGRLIRYLGYDAGRVYASGDISYNSTGQVSSQKSRGANNRIQSTVNFIYTNNILTQAESRDTLGQVYSRTNYTYDGSSRITRMDFFSVDAIGNAVATNFDTYEYNGADLRPSKYTHTDITFPLNNFYRTYVYDANGNTTNENWFKPKTNNATDLYKCNSYTRTFDTKKVLSVSLSGRGDWISTGTVTLNIAGKNNISSQNYIVYDETGAETSNRTTTYTWQYDANGYPTQGQVGTDILTITAVCQ